MMRDTEQETSQCRRFEHRQTPPAIDVDCALQEIGRTQGCLRVACQEKQVSLARTYLAVVVYPNQIVFAVALKAFGERVSTFLIEACCVPDCLRSSRQTAIRIDCALEDH